MVVYNRNLLGSAASYFKTSSRQSPNISADRFGKVLEPPPEMVYKSSVPEPFHFEITFPSNNSSCKSPSQYIRNLKDGLFLEICTPLQLYVPSPIALHISNPR